MILGAGAVGTAALFLLRRFVDVDERNVIVIDADRRNRNRVRALGATFVRIVITRWNFATVLASFMTEGDVLVNLACGIGSADVIVFCQTNGLLYVDTCTDLWEDEEEKRIGAFRQRRLVLDRCGHGAGLPTALICHGANPGLITHFVKAALQHAAAASGMIADMSADAPFAALARSMDVALIHLTDRDNQVCAHGDEGCSCPTNTWSMRALLDEMFENASAACGVNDPLRNELLVGARLTTGACEAIELALPARSIRSRSWSPGHGPFVGYMVQHEEVFSLAEMLSGCAPDGRREYAPSIGFVYSPCPSAQAAVLSAVAADIAAPGRVLSETVTRGGEEIGALILRRGTSEVTWYGCALDILAARSAVPFGNATTVQVAAAVLSGLSWTLRNPCRGLVEPEMLDHEEILRDARPYLGRVFGATGDWRPGGRGTTPRWHLSDLLVRR